VLHRHQSDFPLQLRTAPLSPRRYWTGASIRIGVLGTALVAILVASIW
jgi:hypothetical protein